METIDKILKLFPIDDIYIDVQIVLTWNTNKLGIAGVIETIHINKTISFARCFEYPPFNGHIIPRYRSRAIITNVKILALMPKC